MSIRNRMSEPRPNDSARRGVLLLLALVMLTLFLMLGTTYVVATSQRRTCASLSGSVGLESFQIAKEVASRTATSLLTGAPDSFTPPITIGATSSVRIERFLKSALLLDKYGERVQVGSLKGAMSPISSGAVGAPRFYKLEVGPPAAQLASHELQLSDPSLGAFPGRILGIVTAQAREAAAFRIVAAIPQGGSDYVFIAHLLNVNSAARFEETRFDPTLHGTVDVTIQGREFSGSSTQQADWNEVYDAPDNRNLFLAWVPADTGVADSPPQQWKYVIPSFHRPDKLLAEIKDNPTSFPSQWLTNSTMLRPQGRMSFSPEVDWSRYGIDDPSAALPSKAIDIEHPNFTGSNVRSIAGNKYYFDPVNGPWDVDNDNDGVADSIWIDVGMPDVMLGGVRCQPLAAIMVVDLDSRLNVNVHGSLADDTFGASPKMKNPPADWGVFFAGTDPAEDDARGLATAKAGLGWGPAELALRHVLGEVDVADAPAALLPGNDTTAALLRGNAATGAHVTSAGVEIPNTKAEGRFGDSANLSGLLSPSPGKRGISDPPIGSASAPRDNHFPNHFGTDGTKPIGSPIDPFGITQIVLDQAGQPYYSRPGSPASWAADTVDDPYDISLGNRAPKPGWLYDPNVASGPSVFQDNLFAPSHLERALRLREPHTETLSPRLVSLLGQSADKARRLVTTESWDTTAVCVPLLLLKKLLELSDQTDQTRPSLVSWDLQMGVKMDVNRPFGDGLDNDGNGVADEPGEVNEPTYGLTAWTDTHLCNGRAPNAQARALFARHLYCLVRYLCPNVPTAEAAQWAVNVVDFRDSDSIMTRFDYDSGFDPTNEPATWTPDAVAWGCERPEMLLTEAIAWNNVREQKVGETFTYSDEKTGSLVIELYHPWTALTDENKRANPIPAEFTTTGTHNQRFQKSATLDLSRTVSVVEDDGNAHEQPVFQVIAVEDTAANRQHLADDVSWPNDTGNVASIRSVLYPGKNTSAPPQKNSVGEWHEGWKPADNNRGEELYSLLPGQFAVLGTTKRASDFESPDITGDSVFLSPFGHDGGLAGVLFDLDPPEGDSRGFSDASKSEPIRLQGNLVQEIIKHHSLTAADRKTAIAYPKDAQTGGPIGAVVPLLGNQASTAMGIPIAIDANGIPQPKQFRILLRRLANPLRPFDAENNPYITIDSLVVQQQVCIVNGTRVAGAAAALTLGGAQRVENLETYEDNNLWRQAQAAYGSGTYPGIPSAGIPTALEWTLGFLPPGIKILEQGDRDTPPIPWLTWFDREYANVHELLLVPKSSPYALLQEHAHQWPFSHLFFGGDTQSGPADDRLGILEFLCTVSRFADAEYIISPADAMSISNALMKPLFLPPHNRLTTFREPGRVNLNTMSSAAIWKAMNGGRLPAPYEDELFFDENGTALEFAPSEDWAAQAADAESPPEVGNWHLDAAEDANEDGRLNLNHDADNNGLQTKSLQGILRSVAASRRGWPLDLNVPIAGQFDRVLNRAGVDSGSKTWFSNAFQTGWKEEAPDELFSYEVDYSLLLRPRRVDDNASDPDDPAADRAPFLLFSPNLAFRGPQPEDGSARAIRRGPRYSCPERNPYFAYQNVIGLSNLTTSRSNVFGVWITIGFFEIEPHPVTGLPSLGMEHSLESGEASRHKAFMIIDRSIGVAFLPGKSLTESATVLLNTLSK